MNPRDQKIADKKKIILDALKRCLSSNVYSRISVQNIATEAGFSKGGILHYFPTKEDIYLELTDKLFKEFYEAHSAVIKARLGKNAELAMSSLVGAEEFILNQENTKILINLILYSFEDEKIQAKIHDFLKFHRIFNSRIISSRPKKEGESDKRDLSPNQLSRIIQSILFSVAVLEFVDPIDIEYTQIASFLTKLLKD